jgi:D-beta-D-heptose 7-phosphate kinase/D-beta-D-heptose 1-phosphate adenosyltransferase
MKKIVLVTGGFDPVHSGHLAYFQAAKQLGDILVVGVNSDAWLTRKKGRPFLPLKERVHIIQCLRMVDHCVLYDDSDGSSKEAIQNVRAMYPQDEIIFANGGDRTDSNIPEMDVKDNNLKFVFGVGGLDKNNSSSWILEEWRAPKTNRDWGYYRVLHEPNKKVKLKELTVNPGKTLSMQRHEDRGELWFVSEGEATLYTINRKSDAELHGRYPQNQMIVINRREWHQLANEGTEPLKVIEIQYGDRCDETDIERQ